MMISLRKTAGVSALTGSFLLFLFLLAVPKIGFGEDAALIKDVRHWENSDSVRFVFDISTSLEFTTGKLSNPERLFFDLKNTRLARGVKRSFAINSALVKSVRLGQYSADTTRIVFDLQLQSYDFKVMNLEDPSRLVIDIYAGASKDKGKPDFRAETKPDKAIPPVQPQAKLQAKPQVEQFIKRTVVIDAGHGGHDPGAIGPSGLYEKNVVLDIALRVREIMKQDYPFYNVILTRESDVFIPLPERAEIANRNNADLFVSVHANSSTNNKARGIETYLLNWSNDTEALKVAARENAISLKKMKQMKSELGVILASLERESKRDESVKIAGCIQNSLSSSVGKKYPEVNDLGVKQALFYVLVGAKMPSTLVEVSFISNPKEERLLASDSYRQFLARSIADGIHKYFSSQPLQNVVLESVESEESVVSAEPVKYASEKGAR
ncbi:MAG: N-acetylmuramoyl-L-alanine amidase [Dissulfurispiraceae bacterium]|jgi:N-acetylmuramoyl-L-alanine amidase